MPKHLLSVLGLLALCFGLPACTNLLEMDFRKATLVTEVELGSSKLYTRTFAPPSGVARLILAAPNHRCSSPADGAISFRVRADGKNVLSTHKRLSDLTWSHGQDSCHAYGYVAGSEGSIDIKDAQLPVTFEIDVSQIKVEPQRRASVWLIYGDRVPAAKIFGEKK